MRSAGVTCLLIKCLLSPCYIGRKTLSSCDWSSPPFFPPLPLPSCWPANLHQMFLKSGTVLADGDIEAGRRISLPTGNSLSKARVLDSERGQEELCACRGSIWFSWERVPWDAGGLPRGGDMHTNCIHSPLWRPFLPTQWGVPHASWDLCPQAGPGTTFLSGLRTMHYAGPSLSWCSG